MHLEDGNAVIASNPVPLSVARLDGPGPDDDLGAVPGTIFRRSGRSSGSGRKGRDATDFKADELSTTGSWAF